MLHDGRPRRQRNTKVEANEIRDAPGAVDAGTVVAVIIGSALGAGDAAEVGTVRVRLDALRAGWGGTVALQARVVGTAGRKERAIEALVGVCRKKSIGCTRVSNSAAQVCERKTRCAPADSVPSSLRSEQGKRP